NRFLCAEHGRGGVPDRKRDGAREARLGLPCLPRARGRHLEGVPSRDADRPGLRERPGSAIRTSDAEPLRIRQHPLRHDLESGWDADHTGRRHGLGCEDPQGGLRQPDVLRGRRDERRRLPRGDELRWRVQGADNLLLQEQPVGDLGPRREPIDRMRKYLELKGLWSKDRDDALRAELDDLVQNTIKEVERNPPPPIETLFGDVFADMSPQVKEQMEAYLASGERRRPEVLDKFPL